MIYYIFLMVAITFYAAGKIYKRNFGRTETKQMVDTAHENYNEIMNDAPQKLYVGPLYSQLESLERSRTFFKLMNKRRSMRFFSSKNIEMEIIENCIKTAGTSPSGAHCEPWTFLVISNNCVKQQIRTLIESEEEINYKRRMGTEWVDQLKPLRTNWIKKYLTEAPYLVLIFKQLYSYQNGVKLLHRYSEISACISIGLFVASIQYAGLTTLVSTPLNCGTHLRIMLNRPDSEKLLALLPVGYAAEDATVPVLKRKSLNEIMIHI